MKKPSAANSQFDELVQTYYRTWFRYHPESAVEAGVPGYAHLLTPYSDEARGALVCLNDELRASLDEIDTRSLDADRRVDYDLLCGAVHLENEYLLEIDPRRPDPRRWLPVNAIYQLTIRPVENLEEALRKRLEAMPAYLKEAEPLLTAKASSFSSSWVKSTATAARRGADFVKAITHHPRIAALDGQAKLETLISSATEALQRFAEFLEREITPRARGEFGCGHDYFEHLLRRRHFLDVGADRLHAFGEHLFDETRSELEKTCQELFGHRDFVRAVHEIQRSHRPSGELLSVYRERMSAARQFVASRGLVTLPERERLEVVETPIFLRHEIPFAAYSEPAPNDPDQVGHYYVTPPANDEQLAEHDVIGLSHTCVHEAYPGHHLQFATANRNSAAHSLPRLLNISATLYEGWALYSEQLMFEQGFLDKPESRILLLRDRLWRALRVMLDVELHTKNLTLDKAADRMVTSLGFPRSQAQADIAWYTRSPTVPLGYATGWALITALRKEVLRREPKTELKSVHDRLLSIGSIAAPVVIRRAFGEEVWKAVKNDVFGGGE